MIRNVALIFMWVLITSSTSIWASTAYDTALLYYYNGQYDQTLKQLEHADSKEWDKVQLLLSLSLLKTNFPKEANQAFKKINLRALNIGAYSEVLKLKFMTTGPFTTEQAMAQLKKVGKSFSKAPFFHRLQLEVAKRAASENQTEFAYTLLNQLNTPLVGKSIRVEALKQLCLLYLSSNPEKAKSTYHELLELSPIADESELILEKLRPHFPGLMLDMILDTESQYATAIEAFYAQDYYGPTLFHGRRFLVKYPESPRTASIKIMMAMATFLQGNIDDSFPLFNNIISQYPHTEAASKAWFYKARGYQRLKRFEDAKATYQAFIDQAHSESYLAEAFYYLYWTMEATGKASEFAPYLAQMKTRHLQNRFLDKLIWELAWQEYNAGHTEQAYALLKEHPWTLDTDDFKSKVLFWTGKMAAKFDPSVAQSYFAKCLMRYPLSFYSYRIAQDQMKESAQKISQSIQSTGLTPDARYLKLFKLGLGEWAAEELGYRIQNGGLSTNRAKLGYTLAYLYHHTGQYNRSIQTLGAFGLSLAPQNGIISEEIGKLMYPRPHWDIITSAAQTFGVDPLLVVALMREESMFNATVSSRVGAIGLMQIMPSTGEGIAKNLKMPWAGRATLFDIKSNIYFGTWYLANLKKRFQNNPALMLAGYNAGPNITSKWASQPNASDMDTFIAGIPYNETNGYVTRVLKSYWIYRLLYAKVIFE